MNAAFQKIRHVDSDNVNTGNELPVTKGLRVGKQFTNSKTAWTQFYSLKLERVLTYNSVSILRLYPCCHQMVNDSQAIQVIPISLSNFVLNGTDPINTFHLMVSYNAIVLLGRRLFQFIALL